MKIKDILSQKEFSNIFGEIEAFTKNQLSEYNDKISKIRIKSDHKEIFDAIWGSVELNSAEICILDSPLLQRLRKIKQLGLASYVYCGADYSRFYHTLGVFYLSDKMASTVKRKINNTSLYQKYDPVQIVKLAALFHDVGHMFLSHVSERYYTDESLPKRADEIKKMLIAFEKKTAKVALHELISVMIVNSSEVRKLLLNVWRLMDNSIHIEYDDDIDDIIEYISCLIIGIPSDRFILPYSRIINGPIDADKCDYLSRDSHVTNVPVAVDIFRLIQKLKLIEVDEMEYSSIWNDNNPSKVYIITGLEHSAHKALQQLLIARHIMYESLYYHHKVLTAETTFRMLMKSLEDSGINEVTDFSKIMELTDDTFTTGLDYFNFKYKENLKLSKESKDLIKKIYNRELSKRVACLCADTIVGRNVKKNDFLKDIIEYKDNIQCETFYKLIIDEYIKLREIAGKEELINKPQLFMVEFPDHSVDSKKIDMRIDFGNGNIRKAKEVFQVETWVQSKEVHSKMHYLVTDQEDRDLVYIALEKILFENYELFITLDASVCAKFSRGDIIKLKKDLFLKGYYNDSTILLPDELIISYLDSSLLKLVIEKFKTFEGIDGYKFTEKNLYHFLKQVLLYNTDEENVRDLLDGVLRLLKNAIYINREYFTKKVDLYNRVNNQVKGKAHICRLGGNLDSSNHLLYYFNDIKDNFDKLDIPESLVNALDMVDDSKEIVFFDDGCYSGKQVVSILQELMGVDVKERATNEHHVDELSDQHKEKLKKANIKFVYLFFNKNSKEYILNEFAKLGLNDVSIIYDQDLNSKVFERSDIFINDEQKNLLKKCLSEISIQLLRSDRIDKNGNYKERWDEERINKSALGYNDAQQMVILTTSVPSYTLTIFWEKGFYKGQKWDCLFPRTKKKNDIIKQVLA